MAISGEGEVQPLDMFLSIGLDRRTAENALVNPKVTANLTAVIKEVRDLFSFLVSNDLSLKSQHTDSGFLKKLLTLSCFPSLLLGSESDFLEDS